MWSKELVVLGRKRKDWGRNVSVFQLLKDRLMKRVALRFVNPEGKLRTRFQLNEKQTF